MGGLPSSVRRAAFAALVPLLLSACAEARYHAAADRERFVCCSNLDTLASDANEALIVLQLDHALAPIVRRDWPRPPRGVPWTMQLMMQWQRRDLAYIFEAKAPEGRQESWENWLHPPARWKLLAYTKLSQRLRKRIGAPPLPPFEAPGYTPPPDLRVYQLLLGPMVARGDSIIVDVGVRPFTICGAIASADNPKRYSLLFVRSEDFGWEQAGREIDQNGDYDCDVRSSTWTAR